MLTIAIKNKKEADHYDRRKKVGTTKASDIWSLACLLYELLTAEYLFHRNDWVNFYIQVTSPQEELLT
jgi:serine/threonine protein kinase